MTSTLFSCDIAHRYQRALKSLKPLLLIALLGLLQACEMLSYAEFTARNAMVKHSWQGNSASTRVPFRLLNNHIMVPVTVNGTELEMVFDTGAGATALINSHATGRVDWQTGAKSTVSDNTSRSTEMAFVHNMEVKLGGLTLHCLSGIHLPDHKPLGFSDLDSVYLDGILGQDHLSRFVVEIDYDAKELVLYEPEYFQQQAKQKFADWQQAKLEVEGTEPFIWITVKDDQGNSAQAKVILDTGSVNSLSIPNSVAAKLTKPAQTYSTSSHGVGGEKRENVAVLAAMELGTQQLDEVLYRVSKSKDGSDVVDYGLLGNGILSRFNTVYDLANERLYFTPNQRFAMKVNPDRSGLTLRPHKQGALVTSARDHAAELGLQRFDVITSVDGENLGEHNYQPFLQSLHSDKGQMQLCWQRGQQQQCGVLPMKNRLTAQPQS